jgi:tetratricopeptide (TPR) repeat protein
MVKGDYASAADEFKLVVAAEPDNVEALAGLGMALGRQYKLDDADTQFDRVLALQPNNPVAHCGKAMVLLYRVEKNQLGAMSRHDALHQAGRECNKALDADPRVVEAHYLLGTVYKEEGRFDLAIQAFSGAIHLDPHYVRAFNMLASVQFQKGNLAEATESYKEAINVFPKNSAAHLGLGEIYMKEARYEDAMNELNAALAINPNSVAAHIAMAKALESRGNSAAAIREYEQVIKLKPDEAEAYAAISQLHESQGEYNAAVDQLQVALKSSPQDRALRERLADDLLQLDRVDDALKEYRTLTAANPSDLAAEIGLTSAYYAKVLRLSGPLVSATPEFQADAQRLAQTAKAAKPTNQGLLLADAVMKSLAGQTPDMTFLLTPSTLPTRLLYGELLLTQGKFSEADNIFAQAAINSTSADDVMDIAEFTLVARALDSADVAFRRAVTFVSKEQRGRHGLQVVGAIRDDANQCLASATVQANAHQYQAAVDKYRAALAANPRLGQAHLGLAEALEKVAQNSQNPLADVRDALFQYKLYLAVSPGLMMREHDKVQKRINKLEEISQRQETPAGFRGLLQRLSVR